ncbi:flagellar FlbD family protein [[Brevibacterium] frigoritolerans]|nr:flagellar FlbD family protein [Peribacillus frigoritolerans]
MIYLTRRDEEKTKFLINQDKIVSVENILNGSNLHMENGKILTVAETDEEIRKKVENHQIYIIQKAIVRARKEE